LVRAMAHAGAEENSIPVTIDRPTANTMTPTSG
jgi:hypothetical protein